MLFLNDMHIATRRKLYQCGLFTAQQRIRRRLPNFRHRRHSTRALFVIVFVNEKTLLYNDLERAKVTKRLYQYAIINY